MGQGHRDKGAGAWEPVALDWHCAASGKALDALQNDSRGRLSPHHSRGRLFRETPIRATGFLNGYAQPRMALDEARMPLRAIFSSLGFGAAS